MRQAWTSCRTARVSRGSPSRRGRQASQLVVSPPALDLVEQILEVLAGAGFQGRRLAEVSNAYVGSVIGWVSLELAEPPGGDWPQQFEATVRDLDPGSFPVITAHREVLA